MKRRIVLLGPPASGKGSQALLIFKKYGIPPVSTGHLLRSEAEADTILGRQAVAYTSKGQLAPDELVMAVLQNWLAIGSRDYVFDGFPRNLAQATFLEPILAAAQLPLEIVIYLKCSLSTIQRRVSNRLVCAKCQATFQAAAELSSCSVCGGQLLKRTDDTVEVLEQRMVQYFEKTAPLVDFYRGSGLLHEVDGDEESGKVFSTIEGLLQA